MSGRGRGRGAYFRAKYRGGRTRGSNQSNGRVTEEATQAPQGPQGFADQSLDGSPRSWDDLQRDLTSLNGQQYGAYKRLSGKYHHKLFILSVDHVQGDAYAPPSRVRAIVQWQQTGFPDEYLQSEIRRVALCDYVTRVCASIIRSKHLDHNGQGGGGWNGPKGGASNINAPGQEILPRTSAIIDGSNTIELRFTASLPAAGRTILGDQAYQILAVNLVHLVEHSLLYANLDWAHLQQHISCAEDQSHLRQQMLKNHLIAFVANGSILPRVSGASQAPMDSSVAVPFRSPKEVEVTLALPDGSGVSGMGIPQGITLLTGGGFHGKSTLLEAIQLGVYNHIPGDGRERVVTNPTAVKIRAEDGRSVASVDISPFISTLPGGKDTTRFSTEDASGSTSMAANIQEALEVGCGTLLIDEDSSATNLLVQDSRMQTLIRNEPITPLISKARSLFMQHTVSTIIVIGGLGDWLSVADRVIAMEDYTPRLITAEAKAVVEQFPSIVHQTAHYGSPPGRSLRVNLNGFRSPYAIRKNFIALKPSEKNPVNDPSADEAGVDLQGLDQIVEIGQSRTIAVLLQQIANQTSSKGVGMSELLQPLRGMDVERSMPIYPLEGDLVAVRREEVAAALSRVREQLTAH